MTPQIQRKPRLLPAFIVYRYSLWLKKHYKFVLFLSLLAAVFGAYYSVQLYKNLRTDLGELLPEAAPSVLDLKMVENRVSAINHLAIVIESENVEAGRRFTKDLVKDLRKLPKTLVDRIMMDIHAEKKFFEENKALYIDLQDWKDIKDYVNNRIRYEQKAKDPFSLGLDAPEKPVFDFEGLKAKYEKRAGVGARFKNGLLESPDGKTHVVLAFLPGKVTDTDANAKLSEYAHAIVDSLHPKKYSPDMVVGFGGDVQNVTEEQTAVVEDLVTSGLIVMSCVALVLLLFFKSFFAVYALLTALLVGTAFTFGVSYFIVGYLNANTAFLGSIVLGNGINFGIIFLARFFEERKSGLSWQMTLPRAIGFTAQATWTAALAAGIAYGSLVLTTFRGFNQFGVIGLLGMVFCWVSAFTTLPAMLIFLEKRKWIHYSKKESKPVFSGFIALAVTKFPRPIVFVTIASIFISSLLVYRSAQKPIIETDFSKLRSKNSMQYGSAYWGDKVDRLFDHYSTPTMILTMNENGTEALYQELQAIKQRTGKASPFSDIQWIEDFVPKNQLKKIKLISNIRSLLPEKLIKRLSDEDKKLVRELLPSKDPTPVQATDLPESLLIPFQTMDGKIGQIVHVYPQTRQEGNFWDGNEVILFTQHIREAIRKSGATAYIAGQPPVSADLLASVKRDGPRLTIAAFLAVAFLVILVFQRWHLIRSVLFALLLGVLWMIGVMAAFDLKINFLNFIALPITFGIGVDYAVNLFSRYRTDEDSTSLINAIHHTGGAVALCSLTTIIGYGSLLVAQNQGFVSFGRLAVLGEFTCLTAALVAMPAIWQLKVKIKKSKKISKPSQRLKHSTL